MALCIDRTLVNAVYYDRGDRVYLLDRKTQLLYDKASDEAEYLTDFIELPVFDRIKCLRTFTEGLPDRSLSVSFKGLSDEDFRDKFWRTFDDGGDNLLKIENYEMQYAAYTIAEWCENNGIPHYVDRKDILCV